jgi:hypothetical protein
VITILASHALRAFRGDDSSFATGGCRRSTLSD